MKHILESWSNLLVQNPEPAGQDLRASRMISRASSLPWNCSWLIRTDFGITDGWVSVETICKSLSWIKRYVSWQEKSILIWSMEMDWSLGVMVSSPFFVMSKYTSWWDWVTFHVRLFWRENCGSVHIKIPFPCREGKH